VGRIGAALDGPGKHGVVTIFLDDSLGVGVHGDGAFLREMNRNMVEGEAGEGNMGALQSAVCRR
jgi:hypothetical protein